jgi:hypothetical protein
MRTATLTRTVKRLAAQAGRSCRECADWPAEIGVRIIEVVVEPGQPLSEPDRPEHPAEYGPCEGCGRTHRAKVIAIED